MRTLVTVAAVVMAAAACSSAPTSPASVMPSSAPKVTATASASGGPGSGLRVPLDDAEVRRTLATWRESNPQTGEPFAAFRGPQRRFEALGCRFSEGADPDRVETVVYVRGSFRSPSGKQTDRAMVQAIDGGRSVATLYASGRDDPGDWCRPPPGF